MFRLIYNLHQSYNIQFIFNLFTKLHDKYLKKISLIWFIGLCAKDIFVLIRGKQNNTWQKRIYGHKSDVKWADINKNKTDLYTYTYRTGHQFHFNNTEILCIETNSKKRSFLEQVYILQDINSINSIADVSGLSKIYLKLLVPYCPNCPLCFKRMLNFWSQIKVEPEEGEIILIQKLQETELFVSTICFYSINLL